MKTEDYVNHDLAVALKKAGFDWPVTRIYFRDRQTEIWELADWTMDEADYNKRTRPLLSVSAPTLAQAAKWLRQARRIAINVIAHDTSDRYREGQYHWEEVYLPGFSGEGPQWHDWFVYGKHPLFNSYEAALSDGLTQMLRLLNHPDK